MNITENILVSVIVPIYNVEKYLPKCLDSIIHQSYENLEIILVDDGSTDKCPLICDDYAKKDKRIKVIHKNNGGLSDARNVGLEIAKGEYCAFIDSDDYVDTDFIKTLINSAINSHSDIAVCAYYIDSGMNLTKQKATTEKEISFNNIQAMKDFFAQKSICGVMTWNKLYKRSLFTNNEITFPIGRIHEDNFTTYKLLYFAARVCYISDPLYYYVNRPGSIMNRGYSNNTLDIIDAAEEAYNWVCDKSIPLVEEVQSYQLNMIINVLNIMLDNGIFDRTAWTKSKKWVRSKRVSLYRNPYISIRQKYLIKLIEFGNIPYGFARKIYSFKKVIYEK